MEASKGLQKMSYMLVPEVQLAAKHRAVAGGYGGKLQNVDL